MQAETARRLAPIRAIFVSGTQHDAIRFGDWDTLAVASAMVGRESDAIRALCVEDCAREGGLDRTCQNALGTPARPSGSALR